MIRADSSAISAPRFSRLDYYTTSFPICQGVFQKFFKNFFQPLFSRSGSARVLYHILSRLSRGFSKVFSTFFVIFFEAVSRGRPLVDSLHIIALSFPFVNRFFESFFGLEKEAVLYKRRAWFLYTMPKYQCFSPSNRRKSRSDPTFFRGGRSNGKPPPACGSDRRRRPVRTCRRPRSPRR